MEYNNEIWRDIVGYEGLYQISNYGRVKSMTRRKRIGGVSFDTKEIFMKTHEGKYPHVFLYKDGTTTNKTIYKLVEAAFLPHEIKYQHKRKDTVVPEYVYNMLATFGNTVVSERTLKKVGSSEALIAIINEESGFKCKYTRIEHISKEYKHEDTHLIELVCEE